MADLRSIFEDLDPDVNHFSNLFPGICEDDGIRYYTYDSYNRDVAPSIRTNQLKVFHLNIRSLFPKFESFFADLSSVQCEFDIVCFTETWLCKETMCLIKLDNYNSYHCIRDGRGGGVSVFVRNSIVCEVLDDFKLSLEYIECIFLKITISSCNYLVIVVYRPPNSSSSLFLDKISELLSSVVIGDYREVFVTGDFNYNTLHQDEGDDSQQFLNVMHSFSLLPIITRPTRVTEGSSSILDNFFITNPVSYRAGVLLTDYSDHFSIFLNYDLPCKVGICQQTCIAKYRILNDRTFSLLYDALSNHDFSNIFESGDVNWSICRLDEVLMEYYDKFCPIISRQVSYKDKLKPWITGILKADIRRRRNMSLQAKLGKISASSYKKFRNYVTSKLRDAKIKYFNDKFDSLKSDLRRTWSLINEIIRPKANSSSCSIKELLVDGVREDNPIVVCDKLNSYFASIGTAINNSVPPTDLSHTSFLDGNFENVFLFSPLNPDDIHKAVISLKSRRGKIDHYSSLLLKKVSPIISPVLCHIINLSFAEGVFPDILKVARVTPLHKGGKPNMCSNYRPISILPDLSKVFERIVHNQLSTYLDENGILCSEQFGFRKNRTTSNAINCLLSYVYGNVDRGKYVFSLFVDFRKAFDCVNHDILLSKLKHYGIRGDCHSWFESYLSGRSQFIEMDGCVSTSEFVYSGVPQGSILGPLLFLVFINDIVKCSKLFKFVLYADDSTLLYSFDRDMIDSVVPVLNSELMHLSDWLTCNKLSMNIDKTKYTIFSYRGEVELGDVRINGGVVDYSRSVKFLGIMIDNNLNFSDHCKYICNKVSKSIGVLNKINYFLPKCVLRSLYYTLIHPFFLYGLEIFYNTSIGNQNMLFKCQKRAMRAINCVPYLTPSHDLFKVSRILKLKELNQFQCSVYVFRSIYLCEFMGDIDLHRSHDYHSYDTRYNSNFVIPHFNRSKSKQSVTYVGSQFWNSLPIEVCDDESLASFKCRLKVSLFANY